MNTNINSLVDTLKMMLFMNSKENSIYNNCAMIIFMGLLTFVMNNELCYLEVEKIIKIILNYFNFLQPKCNTIILEGKICMKVTGYLTKTDNLFSNRFNAFWYYISKNNLNNPTIYSLKEYANSSNIYDDYGEPKNIKPRKREYSNKDEEDSEDERQVSNKDIFIVDQSGHFKLNKNIYCRVSKTHSDRGDEKRQYELDNINIEIYSYVLTLNELLEFIENIDNKYQLSLEKYRNNKKFIYSLVGSGDNNSNSYDRESVNKWDECEFKSTRNFNNLFFESKDSLINKLDFFVNNKSYYEYEGHPYTFGIGLHGSPGTGKTSIIKCIANKLNRHIIVIPLSKIKTQNEFNEYFFEHYYTHNNRKKIDFKDKIIVFEDIDCMTDIVKKRNTNTNTNTNNNDSELPKDNAMEKNIKIQNQLLNKIAKKVDDEYKESVLIDFDKSKDDKITLSFILNIIDGIRETPGRILIISSNNYECLDPALIRPGRIDMTLEMKNASVNTIKEMHHHYYKKNIPENLDKFLKDYLVSPAKLVNLRFEHSNSEDFLSHLLKEFL